MEMSNESLPTIPQPANNSEIKALVREALNELQRDHLKQELLKELRSKESKFSFGKLAGHPAALVFVGFILTGVFGTIITSSWQRKEWDRQQRRLYEIREVEQKEKIADGLIQAVSDSNETEENVLIAFSPEWRAGDPSREKITKERLEAWREQGGRNWRVTTESLWNKIGFYFADPAKTTLRDIFTGILDRRDDIASDIAELESEYDQDKNARADDEFKKTKQKISAEINKNRDDLRKMIPIILEEIRKDVESSNSNIR
jgi:cell division FtsZ-interacting protein ZapD